MENFFGGISDAFSYFGGTTRIAKSDNMKQWVKKYDRYEPAFNDAAVEWAAYYDTTLQTCRVRTPRDKGPVEGLVQKTYNAVYALLHDEVFYNLPSMNARIYELMRVCHKSMAHPFRFSSFSRYRTEKIVFIYNKAQTFTSSGFAFPQKICIFAENFFKYGKDTNKI